MQQNQQREVVKRSLDLRREIGDKIGAANSLRNMGASAGGFFDKAENAINFWEEAKRIAYEMNDRLGIAWNASLQAANFVFKADYDRAQTLIDEAYPHAIDVNDPIVKGFTQIVHGFIVALRDEDYAQADSLIRANFSLDSVPDFRMLIGPFGLILAATASGNDFDFKAYGTRFGTTPFNRQPRVLVPFFGVKKMALLVDQGQYEQAAAFMQAYFEKSSTHLEQPFPMEWARQWAFLNRLRAKIEQALGPTQFAAAWEQGAQLSEDYLTNEVLALFGSDVQGIFK
jgi:hypothetical protein